ncbi:hypothetical protein DPMN_021706 [Dreissena polymorpha]|uniref:Uncharacterized protein n=1 Tax=Dreissena polymorpha TaxID=45954 RepID=A0A9D4NMM2_DREPO|nr:hypothetical protein DPMN_021706 [Dreissena polymorpha]
MSLTCGLQHRTRPTGLYSEAHTGASYRLSEAQLLSTLAHCTLQHRTSPKGLSQSSDGYCPYGSHKYGYTVNVLVKECQWLTWVKQGQHDIGQLCKHRCIHYRMSFSEMDLTLYRRTKLQSKMLLLVGVLHVLLEN